MNRLLSSKQRLRFEQLTTLTTRLTKLISTSVVVLGVFTPVHVASAANPLDLGKEAYSALSSVIPDYSLANTNPSKPKNVLANQPIPRSLQVKVGISDVSSTVPRLDFEPTPDLSLISESIIPILLKSNTTGSPTQFHVLSASKKPYELIATESNLLPNPNDIQKSNLNQKPSKISSQLLENLESGLESVVSTASLVPELPALVAKVYLPDTSDYGLSSNFVWPAQGMLSSRFGWRWGRLHQGIDIAAPVGTPIWAAAGGVVDYAGWNNGGYGNMIDIRHSNGSITRYAHLSAIYVRQGQPVNQSQVIAAMGSTGFSTGPHLHFEIRPNGRSAIDPMAFLARIITPS
ncbi:metalloendopeptidase-like membrane protein [Synechococcus sp. PCC 7502]|uniref:M23 family metallopeptidase n=1 Tax=Synechococcus sp. PCC 7502 TaxID=1173263 RepID=UPI00029FEFF2|nr:M23 family metallopeptidase [Synechococcus sp. PCC 7502]AFY72816.1 metalloendopeptidase-like membrane protein [Synechococcus sp. PCC 7502]